MAEELPKWTAQKIFILVMVVVFLVSSFGLTGLVVWQEITAEDDVATTQLESEEATNEEVSIMQCSQDPSLAYTPEPPLQGKPLPNFEPTEGVTELSCIDIVVGDGKEVQPGATVTAHYTGATMKDGIVFQSSYDQGQPIPFSLDGVIAGWTQGVPGMKVGGIRRLLIPANLAYGDASDGSGRPTGSLVFDIEMTETQ